MGLDAVVQPGFFRFTTFEQQRGTPEREPGAGDLPALRVIDRETREPAAGAVVEFHAIGVPWSEIVETDSEGFASAREAPPPEVQNFEATVRYKGRTFRRKLSRSALFTERFRPIFAGRRETMIYNPSMGAHRRIFETWDSVTVGPGRDAIPSEDALSIEGLQGVDGPDIPPVAMLRVRDVMSRFPLPGLRVTFVDRNSRWKFESKTDADGIATANGIPRGARLFAVVEYRGRRFQRGLAPSRVRAGKLRPVFVGRREFEHGEMFEDAEMNGRSNGVMVVPDRRIRGLGQAGSFARVQVIGSDGAPLSGIRVAVEGAAVEGRTGGDGIATLSVPRAPGAEVVVLVFLPELDAAAAPRFRFPTGAIDAAPFIVRSARTGRGAVSFSEGLAFAVGVVTMGIGMAVWGKKSPAVGSMLTSIGGSVTGASVFSVITRM